MSVRHPKVMAWEEKLDQVFHKIDNELENLYGDRFPLHPARAKKGSTANPEYDGLFSVGAAFSPGYGSKHGPGYNVRMRVATLRHIPAKMLKEIEEVVVQRLREELPRAFPNRILRVDRDGPVFKIYGDLSLGTV